MANMEEADGKLIHLARGILGDEAVGANEVSLAPRTNVDNMILTPIEKITRARKAVSHDRRDMES